MNRPNIDLSSMTPTQLEDLHRLTSRPDVSWPAILVAAIIIGSYIVTDTSAVLGIIPLWGGMLINSVVGYYVMTPIHDGIHFGICRNKQINDWIAQSVLFLIAPYGSLSLFRWGHLQHHRFTNNPKKDPDCAFHGGGWALTRWVFIDVTYLVYALNHGGKTGIKYIRACIPWMIGSAIVISILIAMGYGLEVLMLWYIPSRIITIMLCFSFFWLPHLSLEEEHPMRATTIRIGYEWLLGSLLQGHQYHLIHHLYPSTPFYNNRKTWKLLEPQLRSYDLMVQYGFDIRPKNWPAHYSIDCIEK
ncbi:fatty acid desaturase [Candidatus Nitrosacidococcus sp. I8]|uniref:fatty acid desaturase n=1 Tax=Candidatus Nitrosacidococcus sp. I8 TaxID=2942908 RepID=UPI002226F42D|nr:fatty acid desaturase [Candidatus Nitrosacidococcus sp. I8]